MASTQRYGSPYIFVTWVTGLLSGEKRCAFAAWFKAHYKYEKVHDTNFNSAEWSAKHSLAVSVRQKQLEAEGWNVQVEDQNAFKLHGQTAILAAKPDIVATKDDATLVVDTKTGKRRDSDYFQVLIYILGLKRVRTDLKNISGEVSYSDGNVPIAPEALTEEKEKQIFATLRLIGGSERPKHVPSQGECSWCDVAECTERWNEPVPQAAVAAGEF